MVRAAAWVVAGAVCVTWAVLTGADDGYPIQAPRLSSGAAWVASPAADGVTLLDGSTARVAVHVHAELTEVVQHGPDAYAVNTVFGTVRRIDGATLAVGPAATPIDGAGRGLRVVATDRVLYAVDTATGRVALLDPSSLVTRHESRPDTAAALTGVVPASDGRLWLFEAGTGNLTVVSAAGERTVHRIPVPPGAGTLMSAGDRLVVLDASTGRATPVDQETGEAGSPAPIVIPHRDARPAIGGAAGGRRLHLAAGGAVTVCDLDRAGCAAPMTLPGAGPSLGVPVEADGRLFVPDYAHGDVFVVDPAGRRVAVAPTRILGGPGRLTLIARDGMMFFNDPMTDRAGVISSNGTVRGIRKYTSPRPTVTRTPVPAPSSTAPSSAAPTPSFTRSAGSSSASPPRSPAVPGTRGPGGEPSGPGARVTPGGPGPTASTLPSQASSSSPGGADSGDGEVRRLRAGAPFDYQIGSPYEPASSVEMVSRDREDEPVAGLYNICYIDAFMTRPQEYNWWLANHLDLLLRERPGGRFAVPEPGSMQILDTSTAANRDVLAGIVGAWIDQCADRGFQAVELDNMDAYRLGGDLSTDSVIAYLKLLIDRAHAAKLEVGQTNEADLAKRAKEAGADFAIIDGCGQHDECAVYQAVYGDRVFDIEYEPAGLHAACRISGGRFSVILRDLDVSAPGSRSYVYETC